MIQIQSSIDELVKKIKKDEALSDLCFVKGFSFNEQPAPLNSYMIAVSTLDAQIGTQFVSDAVGENLKGSMYDATLKFRIYAPKNKGGEGLVALATDLCNAIRKNDAENVCNDIKVSGISFDEQMMSVYRDVVAQLSFCMYEEVLR